MKVCIFPDTVPSDDTLFPLVQVFEQVVYCQPVENEETENKKTSPLCSALIEEERCIFSAPAPLGRDRDRFLTLIKDLQNRRDDYASQLSYLALAGLSDKNKQNNESKSSIIGELLQSGGIDSAKQKENELVLWQARLLLKLGEFFDEEQADLNRQLAAIKIREDLLLENLRHEQSDTLSLTGGLATGEQQHNGLQKLRLKAWARLFGLGNLPPKGINAFITIHEEAVERLLDMYGQLGGIAATPFAQILLPVAPENTEDTLANMAAFRQEKKGILDLFQSGILAPDKADRNLLLGLNDAETTWAQLLATHYPKRAYGRRSLALYHLPGVDAGRLFLETFAREQENQPVQKNDTQDTGMSIGLLTVLQ